MLHNSDESHTFLFTIEKQFAGLTIKEFLRNNNFSASLIRRIKREGRVLLNLQESRLWQQINPGDTLFVDIGIEMLDTEPEDIPIKIIYEDKDLLIVNKDPYIVTHPLRSHPNGTLANAIAAHFQKNKIVGKVRFVNRLDKNTSGLIVISKNLYAHEYVQKQMRECRIVKKYWAVAAGRFAEKAGTINVPIGRETQQSLTRKVMDNGQKAITAYRVLEEFANASLVELKPKTGRTHQLRVHMQYLGHPILGDDLYNSKKCDYISRQALHARNIEFILPRVNKLISLTAELAGDIKYLLTKLE